LLPAPFEGRTADVIAALDVAVARCEEWRGEFWVRAATLLRSLRTAASTELCLRDEERVSHAVA